MRDRSWVGAINPLYATQANPGSSPGTRRPGALDYYTAQKAYALVLVYPLAPVLASNPLDYHALVVQPSYGWDWTSIRLKK